MAEAGSILIVDDDEDILAAGRLLLRRQFGEVLTCRRPERIPELLAEHDVDAVLLDMNFGPGESSGAQGLDWLQRILAIDPQLVVVMITAHGSVDTVVEAMKHGATDFVAKPWQNEKLAATMSAAVKLRASRRENESLKQANRVLADAATPGSPILGRSRPMRDLMSVVRRAAPTDANVLILGENGTGKELVARELHRLSQRADAVFLGVDVGAVTESLFESELFGHRKGAFTGATETRTGRFQAAHGGTLFLDEIGNLAPVLQAKLLRVLETRVVTPVGSNKPEPVDVRIISATNVPTHLLRDKAHFRPDLLFRLNTVELTVPPLRERRDDILPIARHYLEHYGRKYGKPALALAPDAEQALVEYSWPGNVRALQHVVERAVILSDSDTLAAADFPLGAGAGVTGIAEPRRGEALNLQQLEKDTIAAALRKHGFNISHAAQELGLTRASLYRRMEKHGL